MRSQPTYLVVSEDAGRDMNKYLSVALATKGLKVTACPIAAQPKQADT